MPTAEEKIKQSINYRGQILHLVAEMEDLLNSFIITHFCSEDRQKSLDMQNLLLGDDRITLNNKVQVFQFLAKNYYKDWYNEYETKNKDLNKDLIFVIEERNVFAHKMLSIHEYGEFNPGDIRFLKFKNSVDLITYNDTKFNELCDKVKGIINHFIKFFGKAINYISPSLINRLQPI